MTYDPFKAAGDEPQREYSKPRTSRSHRSTRSSSTYSAPQQQVKENSTKPPEVSDDLWGIVEQWWELGISTFGKNPIVRRAEFAKALGENVNSYPDAQKLLKAGNRDRVTWILSRMSEIFWGSLEEGVTRSNAQHRYFETWEDLWYSAVTSIEVRELKDALAKGEAHAVRSDYKTYEPDPVRRAKRAAKASLRREKAQVPAEEVQANLQRARESIKAFIAKRTA